MGAKRDHKMPEYGLCFRTVDFKSLIGPCENLFFEGTQSEGSGSKGAFDVGVQKTRNVFGEE